MATRTFPTLKAFYYLEHFHEMLEFVQTNCAELLGPADHRYIAEFKELEREEQGLLVRLANRKGQFYRRQDLCYSEIPDCDAVCSQLTFKGFFRQVCHEDFPGLVTSLKKSDLLDLIANTGESTKGLTSLKKAQVLDLVLQHCRLEDIEDLDEWVAETREEEREFLQFLFFGRQNDGVQAFALRDLGIVRTRSDAEAFKARFRDREDALNAWFYSRLNDDLRVASGEVLLEMARECKDWPVYENSDRFDHSIARLGAKLERSKALDAALSVYQLSNLHPARERRARLLYAAGERDAVEELLKEIIEAPSCDDELLFATDFSRRKFGGKRLGMLTEMLRSAPVIKVDEAFRDSAERAAASHYREQGWRTYFTENSLWNVLFGLVFWDELLNEGALVSVNEFDWRPVQLLDGSFAEHQAEAIAKKLKFFGSSQRAEVLELISKVFNAHYGTANALFRWRRMDEQIITDFLKQASLPACAQILKRVATDRRANISGFPDLLLVKDGQVKFLEVKGEGDQIRRQQLVQLTALESAGFDVGVVRVEWYVDPAQEYVVVDIETTGGRSEHHRITEIGAVKVKNGEIVDRYETLINPERKIPANITTLTGISDAMVADAPLFPEIAEEFREFVGEAIFVAHSAKFDYGFIRQEFDRMGERFRRPTLCTVVAMRKFFPGLESYKLARLSEEFEISLERHHRALCDAEATAHLLMLINEKRLKA